MPAMTVHHLAASIRQVQSDAEAGSKYVARLVPEGIETGDGRIMLEGSLRFRAQNKLPLLALDKQTPAHLESVFVGNLVNPRFEEFDGVKWAVADVEWDTDEEATEFRRMVDEDRMRTLSVDGTDWEADFVVTKRDEEGMPLDVRIEFSLFEIGAATIVPIQAMDGSEIERVASAVPVAPPGAWFEDPQLAGPTRLTVDESGRVFGHIATWDSCHVGHASRGVCLTPPHSQTGYRHFHRGDLVTAEGESIAVGNLTMDTGHAPVRGVSSTAAAAHYDDTGMQVAQVRAGEDEHGIWVAGALMPGLDELTMRRLRAAGPSGDWRRIGGNLEMVACLQVNMQGHPVEARVASGVVDALTMTALPMPEQQDTQLAMLTQIRDLLMENRWAAELDQMTAGLDDEVQAVLDDLVPDVSETP